MNRLRFFCVPCLRGPCLFKTPDGPVLSPSETCLIVSRSTHPAAVPSLPCRLLNTPPGRKLDFNPARMVKGAIKAVPQREELRNFSATPRIPALVRWLILTLIIGCHQSVFAISNVWIPLGVNQKIRVSRASVYRIVHTYEKYGDVYSPRWSRKRSSNRMNPAAELFVKECIDKRTAIYLDEI